MRVPPPDSLRLDRQALLAEVRAHLGERLPEWVEAAADDPTDPGWLILEQVAWMVELLSEQLDRYPFSILQQLVHLMDGHLRPALPALGVVVVEPSGRGALEQRPDQPEAIRFYAPQTEQRDSVAFVPAEPRVDLRPGGLASLCRIEGGALQRVGRPGRDGLRRRIVPVGGEAAAAVDSFADEEVRWTVRGARGEELAERLRRAVDAVRGRGVGWLGLEVVPGDGQEVAVVARVSPDEALLRAVPEGLAPGGDLQLSWGRLDESTWTPPVQVADRPGLPLGLRRTRPLPGDREGLLLIPGLPPDEPLRGLLERRAAPMPRDAVAATWRTLVAQDESLAGLRPELRHGLATAPRRGEPGWLDAALADGRWSELAREGRLLAEVRLEPDGRGAGRLRVGLLLPPGADATPPVLAVGLEGGALQRAEAPIAVAWELSVPPTERGHRLQRVVALDIDLDDAADGVLLCVDGPVAAVLMDCLLVINAPAEEDRRELLVQRAAPEAVPLMARDIVSRPVLDLLLEAPLPASTRAVLRQLPLAHAEVEGGRPGQEDGPLRDFAGVALEPTGGLLTLNAPGPDGVLRRLRPGTRVDLRWYRRTDGAMGQLPAGAIEQVDPRGRRAPRIVAVRNPVGTVLGADRELEEAAVRRLFGGAEPVPVVPSDWERAIRRELGPEAAEWMLRCWSHAERSLVARASWQATAAGGDLVERLAGAGPETLLVVLGPRDGALDEEALDRARQVVDALVARVRRRLPTIRAAVVARCWPLTLDGRLAPDAAELPAMELFEAEGELVDELGRRSPLPPSRLLLDAAVVRVLPPGRSP